LFKNAPGVFVPDAGRFPLLTVFPAHLANALLPDPMPQQSHAIPIRMAFLLVILPPLL
jgi:hypothetical protein